MKRLLRTPEMLRGRRKYAVIALPYLWMTLFFFVPFLIILKISFAEADIAIPPYTSLLVMKMTSLMFHSICTTTFHCLQMNHICGLI